MERVPARLKQALADRYRLYQELGQGGMATVYLAEDLRHHRQVALKVVKPDLAQALGPERFLREVEVTARLDHPHILPLLDSGEADRLLYYVMPYVEGESLRDRLNREKQLPLDDALQIAREVADALSYAHSHGVVHRDIKPENILLGAGHARVADFGIARAIWAAGGETLTATGVAVGTPMYMSPEQAAGARDLDGRSDLYSLGCVLYEMLAGQPPFTGPTVESLVHQHLAADPPNVTSIRRGVPAWVAAALERALAKTPADRFSPVALFAEALSRRVSALASAATAAAPTPERAVPQAWRRRAVRFSVIGVAAAVVLGGAALTLRVGRDVATPTGPAYPRTALAVLPFQNLSAEGPHAYFAGGLHDELLTQLSKVAALSLRGRTSVMGYIGTTKSIPQIAGELEVGTLVQGSVQVVGGRLRVNVQLIDATTDEHLWAESYDRTLEDAFAIQSDVAQRVAAAVGAALGTAERDLLADAPTANADAYQYYLRGIVYFRAGFPVGAELFDAAAMFDSALALDPTFALAHARLSMSHGGLYWGDHDATQDRLRRAQVGAETALRIKPDLPEGRLALAFYYYWGHRDYDRALRELTPLLALQPNNSQLLYFTAGPQRRAGHFLDAAANLAKASDLDPLWWSAALEAANTYLSLREYDLAERYFARLHAIRQRQSRPWLWAYVRLMRGTPAAEVRTWLEDSVGSRFGEVIASAARGGSFTPQGWRLVRALCGSCQDAPKFVEDQPLRGTPKWQYHGAKAVLHSSIDQAELARAYFDSAAVELEGLPPQSGGPPIALAYVYAALGRRGAAIRAAEGSTRWLPVARDAWDGTMLQYAYAEIAVMAGEYELALEKLEFVLSRPSWASIGVARADPLWDPVRGHPRFQALLMKYAER